MNTDAAEKTDKRKSLTLDLLLVSLLFACSVEDISGITSSSLSSVIASNPGFLPLLFIRSFSSMLVGGETAASYGIPIGISVLFGLFVIFCYGYAFYLNMEFCEKSSAMGSRIRRMDQKTFRFLWGSSPGSISL